MNITLILSGGTGIRLGADIPKQYIEVCGRPIISYCLERLAAHGQIDAVQIVADRVWREFFMEGVGISYDAKKKGHGCVIERV